MKQRTLMSFFKTKKSPSTRPLAADASSLAGASSTVVVQEDPSDEIAANSSLNNSSSATPQAFCSDKEEREDSATDLSNTVTRQEKSNAFSGHNSDQDDNDDGDDENLSYRARTKRSTRSKKTIIESDDGEADDAADAFVPEEEESEDAFVPDEVEETFSTPNSSFASSASTKRPKRKLPSQSTIQTSRGLKSRVSAGNSSVLTRADKPSPSSKPSSPKLIIPDKYSFLKTYREGEKTVHIPQSSFAKFTDFEKQYWTIKKDLMDVVLLFKKGKFYEVYENDALLANRKFDWKIAGQSNSGNFANSPQNSHGRAGMVMGGIPEMSLDYWINQFVSNGYKVGKVEQMESLLLKNMQNNNGKKVVERELECIFSKGSMDSIDDAADSFLVALTEINLRDSGPVFEAHIADLSVNKFYFQKMSCYQELETFLLQVSPKEIVVNESRGLSEKAEKLVKFHVPNLQWSSVVIDCEAGSEEILTAYLDYLKVKLPENIMYLEYYAKNQSRSRDAIGKMTLESNTLRNLEILKPTTMTKTKGSTLFSLINYSVTGMGERLLKKWVLSPLFQPRDIIRRQTSVKYLIDHENDTLSVITDCFKNLADLERLLGRLVKGNLPINIFHEHLVKGFASCVECFMILNEYINDESGDVGDGACKAFQNSDLCTLIQTLDISKLDSELRYWKKCYQFIKNADGTSSIRLDKGVDAEFDDLQDKIDALNDDLERLLVKYRRDFNNNNICYKNQGKEILTLECPVEIVKKIPKDWTQTSMTKAVKRYYSPELQKMANTMLEFQELYKEHQKRLTRNLYAKFASKKAEIWDVIIDTVAQLDCLASLSVASKNLGFPSCMPSIQFSATDDSYVKFKELRHPYTTATRTSFIPNDVSLNCDSSKPVTILTGSNASGKSTVLRMSSIAIIMGQLGMYVPASEASFTPMDKILTRLGSNDNLLQGKSTFLMELEDVANLLSEIDRHTFIIIDELGRGGSSKDGFALCESVLYEIVTKTRAVGYFATHYNGLYKSFNEENVNFNKMTHFVKDDGEIVFLYKIASGISESSMGLAVAKLCGIDESIIEIGKKFANDLEHTSRLMRVKQFDDQDHSNASKLISFVGLESDFEAVLNASDLVTFGRDKSAESELAALTRFAANVK